jgi:hypothetical protein
LKEDEIKKLFLKISQIKQITIKIMMTKPNIYKKERMKLKKNNYFI